MYACDEHKSCHYAAYSNGLCYLKDKPTKFVTYKNRPNLFALKRIAMKPFVSDSWAESKVVTTAESSYRSWTGMPFTGPDRVSMSNSSLEECLTVCDDDTECLHLNWDPRTR